MQTPDGLVLIDPPGALTALPEADIAQICSQVGGVDATRDLIDLACTQDPSLDPSAIAAFAGLNFFIWTGYMLAQHSNPDARRNSRSLGTNHEDAQRYLRLAWTPSLLNIACRDSPLCCASRTRSTSHAKDAKIVSAACSLADSRHV